MVSVFLIALQDSEERSIVPRQTQLPNRKDITGMQAFRAKVLGKEGG
jgi:hypothetical protein